MNYFVTGATGFIGRHLVEQLLKREGTVYALVREGSRGRLDELGERLGAGDRLVPVPGDLSQPNLGIEGFSEPIDHFFHLAAIYDMDADEDSMRRANVDGTHHVVQFANSLEVGTFHHTSSIAVAGKFKGLFREDMFDEGQELPHAYHQTKFESEKLVRAEVQAPLRVYRPGIVVGHSVTGEMDKIDGPYYFFKLIQRLRHALPEWFPVVGPEGNSVNVVPVDFIARAMDHIAHLPADDVPGDTFHLADPEPLTVGQVLNEFAKAAHAPRFAMRVDANLTNVIPKPVAAGLKALPTIAKIRETVLRDLHIPPAALENRDFDADFDTRDTQRALHGTGIAVPPLPTYASKLWDYWERNLDPDLFKDRSFAGAVNGKTVVITGASSGIGRAAAIKVAAAGGIPLLVARTAEKLEEVKAEIERDGGTAYVYSADLSDYDSIDRLVEKIFADHASIDVLVNNAGRSIRRSVALSYDRFHDYERTIRLNYLGTVKL
ncbi:MAG TPA: SDR family oxidoreductase, partial [Thermoleophilaceae bacterium]|nr:SDR family oxidoreductase [Thermoleophilaceae bacterium]